MARDRDGVIHVFDSKVNAGSVTPNQKIGYPDMSAGKAEVYTSRLQKGYGLRNGDLMPATKVKFDHWTCPLCE